MASLAYEGGVMRDSRETQRLVMDGRKAGETLQAIGDKLGLSKERVRQYEARAIRDAERYQAFADAGGLGPDTPLELAGLSTRALNCCKNWEPELKKVSDLLTVSEPEFLRTPNFGKACLRQIQDLLKEVYGDAVRLRDEPKPEKPRKEKPKKERVAREPGNGWFPIDTAPLDGTLFLAWVPWRGPQIVKWQGDPEAFRIEWRSNCKVGLGNMPGFRPSHWKPLNGP
jgi:hypothetical protein